MRKISVLEFTLLFMICAALMLIAGCSDNQSASDSSGASVSSSVTNTKTDTTFTVTCVGEKTTTQTVRSGEKAVMPSTSPKKAGYAFTGWYIGNDVYDWDTPVTANITVEARFIEADFDIAYGVAYQSADYYVSVSDNTLIVINNVAFSKGLLTASIKPVTANDCGVIFGLDDNTSDYFWENEEYYIAMINSEGYFILAKVGSVGNVWKEIYSTDALARTYSPLTEYEIKIFYKDGDCIIAVNEKVVYSGVLGELMGNRIGYRTVKSETVFGKTVIDESAEPIENLSDKVGEFYVNSGRLSVFGSSVMTRDYNSLGVWADKTLENGVFSAKLTKRYSDKEEGTDNGIVFRLSDGGRIDFWENVGVSYYFFFLTADNNPYLGKVTGDPDAPWMALAYTAARPKKNEYVLKVNIVGNYIQCYVDEELVFAYADGDMLDGDKVGLRAGGVGEMYSDFSLEAKQIEEQTLSSDYIITNGSFRVLEERTQVLSDRSIAVKSQMSFISGTYSANVTANGHSGLVFGLDDNGKTQFIEEGVYYYFFCISTEGRPVLAKVENGVNSKIKESNLSAMYSQGQEYKLTVVLLDGYAYCYVNDNLHVKYPVTLYGDKVALRGDAGAQFTDVSVTSSTELITAEALIFGHSYTEYWYSYKQDFDDLDILDIGIGGTQTTDWSNLIEEVSTYNFGTAIFMIGINDFGSWNADVTAQKVYDEIVRTVDGLHSLLPDATFALINVNKVPLPEKVSFYGMIDETNVLLAQYAEGRDYVKLVDFASAVLNTNGSFKNYFVSDQLHLNADGYAALTQLVKDALGAIA